MADSPRVGSCSATAKESLEGCACGDHKLSSKDKDRVLLPPRLLDCLANLTLDNVTGPKRTLTTLRRETFDLSTIGGIDNVNRAVLPKDNASIVHEVQWG